MAYQSIDDLIGNTKVGERCSNIYGRVSSVRRHGKLVFLDLIDASTKLQVVLEEKDATMHSLLKQASCIPVGSFVSVSGIYSKPNGRNPEINADEVTLISRADLPLSPTPWEIDGTDPSNGQQVFGFPSFYLASPKRAAVLTIKTTFPLYLSSVIFLLLMVLTSNP